MEFVKLPNPQREGKSFIQYSINYMVFLSQREEFYMHLSSSKFSHMKWIVILMFFYMFGVSVSDSRISEAGLFCGNTRPPPNSGFIPLFTKEMEVLSQLVTSHNWGNHSMNSTTNSTTISIYSLAHCHRDLSPDDCLQCHAASRTKLPRCLAFTSGRIFLDGCFLRYDNYSFFEETVDPVLDKAECNSSIDGNTNGIQFSTPEFRKNVEDLIDNIAASAVSNDGYAVGGLKGVYGLADCWKTVSRNGCRECLTAARREVIGCLPSLEGRALNTGCYLRYSTKKFYSNHSETINHSSEISRTGMVLAIVLSVSAFCMLSVFGGYAAYGRWKKWKQESKNLGLISGSYNKSNLNFKYEILEQATNYFDPSRKLGQGGAGTVYQGTLPNGETVAVKRLFFSTRQWVDEFFNEVNLISGIQHKNLVKLLGCSIEGPESLLVYEFAPNKSLEQYLFSNKKVKILSWKERYNIIVGTAEGIAFLHGGSKFRIIHRDIKTSNVLLDENFAPKIADFGLARSFALDRSHLSTGIAGTLGYMAPEYLVKGQLTEKADVYSFGVLVLEIVLNRKSNAFVDDSGSLFQTVWKMYKTDRLIALVDPSLKGDFPEFEVSRVLKIGLLCTQASVSLRPSMAEVVRMLTDFDCEIPEPNQPPFLNASLLSATSTRSSSSANSLVSKAQTKFDTFYTSTESSIQSLDRPPQNKEEPESKIETQAFLYSVKH